ncbi:MAG TPA: ATP synthase F1 subunit delta [Candidatus Kapabacteria bacterium]|nr:ATP synthase F1 subunit delta [Candidatus Kapabacteria bacterium]
MDSRIAERYALALMGIGKEKQSVQTFAKDLALISESLHAVAELRSLLHSPVIRPDVKRNVLNEIFKPRVSADTITFIDLLVAKGRSQLLGAVTESFQRLLDIDEGIVTAQITSASPLHDAEKSKILQKLHEIVKLDIRPTFSVDPKLRGGFVAKVGDTFVDASVQHQLENLREEWKSAAVVHLN